MCSWRGWEAEHTTQRKTDAVPITDGGGVWRSEWTAQQAAVISGPSQPRATFYYCPFFILTLPLPAVWGRLGKGLESSYVSIVEKHTGMLWVGHKAVVEAMKVLCVRNCGEQVFPSLCVAEIRP